MRKKSNKISNKNNNKIKKYKLFYKIGLLGSFIFLKLIKPLWGQQDMWKVIMSLPKLLMSKEGVVQIDSGRFMTSVNGWDKLNHYLNAQGYEVKILFKDCTFWKEGQTPNYLRGENIGEYFILWSQQ